MKAQVVSKCRDEMNLSLQSLKQDLAKVRTGRATIAMLDGIRVDYYGSQSPVNQVASVTAPEPMLIMIQPWDKSLIPVIEKAIITSDLGFTPQNDGQVIRIPIPSLTEDRRREIVKQVKKLGEQSKVSIRNHRRDANEKLKELQKKSEISEDDLRRGQEEIQKLTDDFSHKADEQTVAKEKDVMTV